MQIKRRLNRIEVITSVAAVVVLYVILESFRLHAL